MVLHFFIGTATFFLMIMCLLFVLGTIMVKRELRFGQRACSAQGVILALNERVSLRRGRRGVRSSLIYYPVVRFRREDGLFAGQQVTCEAATGSFPPLYAVGTHLPLLYDPSHPELVHINTFRGRWLGLCLWCLISLTGIGMFTFMLVSTVSVALHS